MVAPDRESLPDDLRLALESVSDEVVSELISIQCTTFSNFVSWVDSVSSYSILFFFQSLQHLFFFLSIVCMYVNFYCCVKSSDWNTALQCCIDEGPQRALNRASIKHAWKAADKRQSKEDDEDDEDGDKPIKASIREKMESDFYSMFKFHVSQKRSPSDVMLNQCQKQLKTGKFLEFPLKKVKSLASVESGKKKQTFSTGNELVTISVGKADEDMDTFFKSELQLVIAVQVLLNCYLLSGFNRMVGSEPWITLDAVNEYKERVEDQLPKIGIPAMLNAHCECFTKMCELLRQKKVATFDRAIAKAYTENQAFFVMTKPKSTANPPGGKRQGPPLHVQQPPPPPQPQPLQQYAAGVPFLPPPPPPNRPPSNAMSFARAQGAPSILTCKFCDDTKRQFCKPFNDSRGCRGGKGGGPCTFLHACDVKKQDGKSCGSTDHTRLTCPHRRSA